MKRNIKQHVQKYLILTALSVSAVACTKDIFDKKDLTGVDPDIWSSESATNLFLNKTYDLVMPNWPSPGSIHNSTDELNNTTAILLYGQLTDNSVTDIASGNTATTNQYFNINRCNTAIAGINGGTLSDAVKSKLKAQFFFFRAYIYFNLVKLYGGVPLVLKSQDLINDQLNVPRSKTSDCIKQITADLDSCTSLPAIWTGGDAGRISKDVALALKGKVLLYWASPQFNPNDDHPERWTDAYNACKLAYTTALADGYDLYPTYANIFTDETTANKERMMWRTLDNVTTNPARGTNNENVTRPYSETTGGGGSNQPTWNLVQAYPMNNGLPITDGASGYDAEFFWKNRDPRFDASIAYNGCTWNLSGKTNRKQWIYQGYVDDAPNANKTGFYCRRICNPSISAAAAKYDSNSAGGSGMDWIDMRFAEVLLNYAEAANGANQMGEAKTVLTKLRIRAGISQGSFNYGLDRVNSRSDMFTFLLKERQIEFAMEGKRYDDLRRTRQFDKLTGTQRLAYVWSMKSPYVSGSAAAPAGKINIDLPDALGVRMRDTINVNNKTSYEKFFTTSTLSLEPAATPAINYPTSYYFYPLPTNFRNSSLVIAQNIGWPGGSFDPLL